MQYFYQSTNAISTLIDLNNPQHSKLYSLLMALHNNKTDKNLQRKTNRQMKKIGLKPGLATDFIPYTRWSSDCYIIERNKYGLITKWIVD